MEQRAKDSEAKKKLQEAMEAAKMEAKELQATLDAVTMDNLNQEGNWNTKFFEVNDRQESYKLLSIASSSHCDFVPTARL